MKIKKLVLKRSGIVVGIIIVIVAAAAALLSLRTPKGEVFMQTNVGNITLQLYSDKAPITVQNFENYVKDGFYDGTVFHRVVKGFVIQGGGFMSNGTQKPTSPPISLESNNGLSNVQYTIAMARTSDPNSATSQFFINTADNSFLDYNPQNPGYAVFGKVVSGFDTVDKIENVPVATKYGMQDWPISNIIIEKMNII
jgi:cyclophilin family peptidyl-prolyl cis-trans isomerase